MAAVILLFTPLVATAGPFKTLDFLESIKGRYILSGQHNDQKDLDPWQGSGPTNQIYWTERVRSLTGKYPALYGGDFLFHGSSKLRWDMTYEAERQWGQGAVISIMWHACPPSGGSTCQWDEDKNPDGTPELLSRMQSWQWDELLTDGSNLNKVWKSRIDEISIYLQYLEDKGVEVLWRPMHEQNQTAFWWNSRNGASTAALWRLTHDYMTKVKGLSNLIWVWDVQDIHASYGQYNPGAAYFDMMALDVYSDGLSNTSYYNSMLQQAGGKAVAIGECFNLPNAQQIANLGQMTFFMNWAYGLKFDWQGNPTNTDDHIRQVYSNPRVLTRDEMPGWDKRSAPNLAAGRPVQQSSTEAGANVAANAVDGQANTRWSSQYAAEEWISVDLGQAYNINRVRLNWESAYGRAYQIQVSDDANNWTPIYITSAGNGGMDDLTDLKGVGRYVRMYASVRATEWGYSLWEFEVYGTAPGSDAVKIHQHCDYSGWSAAFGAGTFNTAALLSAGGVNDDASSITVRQGYEVTLYTDNNLAGASVTVNGDTPCLVGYGFNDALSSMVVRRAGAASSSIVSSSSSSSIRSSASSSSSSTGGSFCSGLPNWGSGNVYVGGDRVQYQGREYRAKWWTQGDNPSASGEWGVWANVGSCTSRI